MREFKQSGADIVFVQETHFDKGGSFSFASKHFSQIYHSSGPHKRAGVAILIKNGSPFKCTAQYTDPHGHFVILQGQWQKQALTLCTLYTPNIKQYNFLTKVFTRLFKSDHEILVVGGDFNLTHSTTADRQVVGPRAIPARALRDSKLFRRLSRRYALFDAWRALHPGDRQYTFYSAPHKTHSRIDYFFLNNTALRHTKEAKILPISWSDHAPISLKLELGSTAYRPYNWKLNTFLLQHIPSKTELISTLAHYFAENNTPDISTSTLWEAHKAVVRGRCMALSSAMKKDALATKLQTEKELRALENQLQQSPTLTLLKKVVKLRTTLSDLAMGRVEKAILRLRQLYYDKGNKAHSLLAKKLRDTSHISTPHQIKTKSGSLLSHPKDIADTFAKYYRDLYNNPNIPSNPAPPDLLHRMQRYLAESGVPQLQNSDLTTLNMPITEEEIEQTIKTLPSRKAPGPDGLPYEYYKAVLPILLPHMCKLFNAFFRDSPIPSDMQRSFITLIPKPEKDPTLCANYRPIALLNSDLKIFTKLLSIRLNMILPSLVHKDQVGFVPLRQAGDNTRKVIDLVDVANREKTAALLLSLDAEKAFDRLGWPFLFATLQHVGFRGPFLRAIKHLYTNPSSQVRTPFAISPAFSITNGTRQGCPLSPLLFALCVEPLAASIRGNQDIRGVSVRGREFKISLFADDVILTLTQPRISLPNLHAELDKYGALSGYKINTSKSEALPINISDKETTHLKANFTYHWKTNSLKYLGVHITTKFNTLYQENFPPIYRSIRALLTSWKKHHISLLGRIASIKMTILPKLLYLFQTLPIPVPHSHLSKLQSDLFKFTWNYKRHRIPRSVMMAARSDGGLAFPNLIKYYQATQLRAIASWFTQRSYNRWTEIEKIWLAPTHPNNLLWSARAEVPPERSLGTVSHLRRLWNKLSNVHELSSEKSVLTSFIYNPKIPDSLTRQMSHPWSSRNLFHYGHIVDPRTRRLLSYSDLQTKYDLPRQAFYSYLQIRHYALSIASDLQFSPPTPFENLIMGGTAQKGLISDIYKIINAYPLETKGKHAYMVRWEKALEEELPMEQWQTIWTQAAKSSLCTLYKENTYKILLYWYMTPDTLHTIYPSSPDRCWRCQKERGTLLHIYWSCPLIAPYWTEVHQLLTGLLEVQVPMTPKLFLLGVLQPKIPKAYKKLIRHILTAARCLIALNWKKTSPPTPEALYARIKDVESMEKMTARIQDRLEAHNKVWELWHRWEDPP